MATSPMTNQVLILDNRQIAMWAYPDRGIIHHAMKQYCYGPPFREALTKGVEAMLRYKATKWLSDDRVNGAMVREDEEWAVANWVPRALAAGWKHWAIVQPAKVIGQLNMKRAIRNMADLGLNGRMFSDPDEAMIWLDAQ